jgi:hypothetical protein
VTLSVSTFKVPRIWSLLVAGCECCHQRNPNAAIRTMGPLLVAYLIFVEIVTFGPLLVLVTLLARVRREALRPYGMA